MKNEVPAKPEPQITVLDAVALIVGVVVGAGIFRTPSLVASNAGSETGALLFWLIGGGMSLIGALCYAELATTYPHAGGDYHYLGRAFGPGPAFLFAWARVAVIQTGAIAMQAFLVGDYASQILPLGGNSAAWYAGAVVLLLTGTNILGLRQGTRTQNFLSGLILLGLAAVCLAGLFLVPPAEAAAAPAATSGGAAAGLALVFVLLTYGGWNEAAYLSAEMRGGRSGIARALMWSIGIITGLYLLANFAFLKGLGLAGTSGSEAVAADLMRRALGEGGAKAVSLLIVVAALSTVNATIFTGARTNFAFGRDFSLLRPLGEWRSGANTPVNAFLVQGAVALLLVLFGAGARSGFEKMVEYTAPVFWFFLLMVGVALFILRRRDPDAERPFRVPLYPLTPLLFIGMCVYMLRSSLAYTGSGALVGIAVLAAGIPLYLLARARQPLGRRAAGGAE